MCSSYRDLISIFIHTYIDAIMICVFSPRKRIAVSNYCTIAVKWKVEETKGIFLLNNRQEKVVDVFFQHECT